MAKKILLLTLISLIIFLVYEKVLYAQDTRLKTSKPASQDVRDKGSPQIEKAEPKSKPEPVKVLQTNIKSLKQFIKVDKIATMKKALEEWKIKRIFENKGVGSIWGSLNANNTQFLVVNYSNRSDYCLNREYTTSDQQAAGCVGSDTISQCGDKLYKWCMDNMFTPQHISSIKQELSLSIQLANELSKASQDVLNLISKEMY